MPAPSTGFALARRTYVVTDAGSGIGAETAHRLEATGARVIRCDLRDADVNADLATTTGRAQLVDAASAAVTAASSSPSWRSIVGSA
jgi:NADP-dependent 3-hydroxy acid dehydrogenase YdfG